MARVCEEWFPIGSYPNQKQPGFHMDDRLKGNLDILVKNIVEDWFFIILISGSGKVRVGKSVLAMQIGCYWAYAMEKVHGIKVPWDLKENFVFHGKKLIEIGNQLPKYSPFIYDEAGETLEAKKVMTKATKQVADFLREAGQLNLLCVFVLPDFFDLPKGIAVTNSHILLDVDYIISADLKFERGYFRFYTETNKKFLYLKGKKELNYTAHKQSWNHPGRFFNVYTIDEKEYRKMKQEALKSRDEEEKELSTQAKTQIIERNAAWFILKKDYKWKYTDISKRTEQLVGIYPATSKIEEGIRGIPTEK